VLLELWACLSPSRNGVCIVSQWYRRGNLFVYELTHDRSIQNIRSRLIAALVERARTDRSSFYRIKVSPENDDPRWVIEYLSLVECIEALWTSIVELLRQAQKKLHLDKSSNELLEIVSEHLDRSE
jgi:hypothetical protein